MLRVSVFAVTVLTVPSLSASELNTPFSDIELKGGVSAGVFHSQHRNSGAQNRAALADFLVELVSAEPQAYELGVKVGVGSLSSRTVLGELSNEFGDLNAGLQYGWVTVKPTHALSIELGKLATNVGYEVRPSYANTTIALSGVWSAQPNFYTGARANYTLKENTAYVEVENYQRNRATHAWGVGWRGRTGEIDYGINYFNAPGDRRLYDFVLTIPADEVVFGLNLNYVRTEPLSKIQDDHGLGIALYVLSRVGDIELPVRVESLRDGNSGIYGLEHGWTLAVTPTLNMGKTGFTRAELTYVSAGDSPRDPLTLKEKPSTNWTVAMQVGTQF